MKLQKLFVATAILASTATGVTAFAADGEIKTEDNTTNTVGFNPGKKQITAAPEFKADQQNLGSDAEYTFDLSNTDKNVLAFEDFTGEGQFTLTATQTGAFKNTAANKSLKATLTYSDLALTSKTGTGAESKMNLTDTHVFDGNDHTAKTVVTNTTHDGYGKWEIAIGKTEVKASQNQTIAKGAYASTVNWNIGTNPSATVK